jgi:hypothetical protein
MIISFIIYLLGRDMADDEIDQLRKQLYASYPGDREKAARRLADLGPLALAALSDLETRTKDPSNGVRDAARAAITIMGQAASPTPKARTIGETSSPPQTKEILTLKPTFMGMSVDLKELWHRFVAWRQAKQ